MTKQQSKPENKNSENNNRNHDWIVERMNRILEHKRMDEHCADVIVSMLDEWRKDFKKREIKRIDDEIARLNTLKQSLSHERNFD